MTQVTYPGRCLCEWTARSGEPGWRRTAPFPYCPLAGHREAA
jgi:hypothetical protein